MSRTMLNIHKLQYLPTQIPAPLYLPLDFQVRFQNRMTGRIDIFKVVTSGTDISTSDPVQPKAEFVVRNLDSGLKLFGFTVLGEDLSAFAWLLSTKTVEEYLPPDSIIRPNDSAIRTLKKIVEFRHYAKMRLPLLNQELLRQVIWPLNDEDCLVHIEKGGAADQVAKLYMEQVVTDGHIVGEPDDIGGIWNRLTDVSYCIYPKKNVICVNEKIDFAILLDQIKKCFAR